MSFGAGGTPAFEGMFRVYSVAMTGKGMLETGDKLLLPSSALSVLTRMAVQYPMHFKVTNVANNKVTHCGVMEFTAEEGRCYMPHWVRQEHVCSTLQGLVYLSTTSFILTPTASPPYHVNADNAKSVLG
jgi:hypothetical protein